MWAGSLGSSRMDVFKRVDFYREMVRRSSVVLQEVPSALDLVGKQVVVVNKSRTSVFQF